MTVKDGATHLKSLHDGREVFLDGKKVDDVTTHPAFRNAIRSVCDLYDFQARPENQEVMTFESPTRPGTFVNRSWMQAQTYDDFVSRRKSMMRWAEPHYGFMGRSPDHVASALTGQAIGLEVFEKHGSRHAQAMGDYHAYCRDNDLYLTYVIINPQADRSKNWGEQEGADMTLKIVDEDSEGVTVRGAKMLGTGSIMANEVFVANLQPLFPGEEDYAISFGISLAAKGIKILSRRSFEAAAPNEFDRPLSHKLDENDALVYFDDVKVPWERIFVFRDTDMCRAQFHDTPGHIYQNHQSQVRLVVKLKFLLGIARRMCETIGTIKIPAVQQTLGRLASEVSTVEGLLYGMEAAGEPRGKSGHWAPRRNMLYAAQVYTQSLYATFTNDIRELAGGALIMLPSSSADFGNPELANIIERTQISSREGETAEDRIKFLNLAWDALGSEYAGRHAQYEAFYAGAQFVTCGHSMRTYPWEEVDGMVTDALGSFALDTAAAAQAAE